MDLGRNTANAEYGEIILNEVWQSLVFCVHKNKYVCNIINIFVVV